MNYAYYFRSPKTGNVTRTSMPTYFHNAGWIEITAEEYADSLPTSELITLLEQCRKDTLKTIDMMDEAIKQLRQK